MDSVKPHRVALSRELSEFLVELSIAVQKHSIYPGGHPSLAAAVAGLTRRAGRLLDERTTLVFGVARRQLIIDGVATDPDQPVLRRLAEGLHRHHLGAVSLSRGLEVDELEQALRALSLEVDKHGPLGLAPPGRELEWPHVRLHPLTFDRLELVRVEPDGAGLDKAAMGRAAELWIGLARAAMATSDRAETATGAIAAEPASVARAIDEHEGATAYDQVIIGYLLQIAQELQTASGAEAAMLRTRTARLIAALKPETLRRLVEMGGDQAQRRAFVINAASGMAVDAVIDILKAAAEASGQTISHGLTRMLSKLAAHAELGHEQVRPLADGALREQVGRLLSGWELADPNPDAYSRVLQHIAHSAPVADGPRTAPLVDHQDALRLVQMSLEVGDVGPPVDRAIDQVLGAGRFGALLGLLASVPPEGGAVAARLRIKLTSPASITALTVHEPFDVEALDQLLPLLSPEGYEVLLDALAESASRSTRRRLLDRLPHTPLAVAPLVAARLHDRRWFVVRNMLVLLQRLPGLPAGFSPSPWVLHADSRVRHEALVLQLAVRDERESALRTALNDADPRTLRLGVLAAQLDCPPSAVPLIARLAHNTKMIEELRQLAIRALGRSADARARDALLQLVDGGRTLLGRAKLAPTGPVCIAALETLAERWPQDAAVVPTLALAASSPDPVVRQAVARRGDGR
jgi:hypothetical protein